MIALAILFAAVFSDRIVVPPGQTVIVDLPSEIIRPGVGLISRDESVASVHVPGNPYAANRKAVIQGIRPGTAEVIAFEAGFSEIRSWQVATVFVCTTPTIALDRHSSKVAVGSDVTLTATPSGTGGLDVNWFEGDHYLGTGTTFTFVNLPPGKHRITASITNECGFASSEAAIEVVPPRNRPAGR